MNDGEEHQVLEKLIQSTHDFSKYGKRKSLGYVIVTAGLSGWWFVCLSAINVFKQEQEH